MFRTRFNWLLAGLLACSLLILTAAAPSSLEAQIKQAKTSATIPDGFAVAFRAMHPLYGGTEIEISGDGTATRTTRDRGSQEDEKRHVTLSEQQLLQLVALLVEHEAWEQRIPERQAVPDEGKAYLELRIGAQEGGFWEWYNDMGQVDRLQRISALMKELVPE